MGSIGFYITILFLGTGAVLLNQNGEPTPPLASGQKKLLLFLSGVFAVCILLLVVVVTVAENSPMQ